MYIYALFAALYLYSVAVGLCCKVEEINQQESSNSGKWLRDALWADCSVTIISLRDLRFLLSTPLRGIHS